MQRFRVAQQGAREQPRPWPEPRIWNEVNNIDGNNQRKRCQHGIDGDLGAHYGSLPKRPAGRQIKTTAMMMKTTMLEASG